ncbi:hypothetical protein MNBD_GAMMA02-1167 [hydrothermal vent metagenome]|uniref:Uncharacterized protein n=1 Tax=hydrothermal vent metagenome TaxID=652676 RepID=A0A3B0W601_9ZZZZ
MPYWGVHLIRLLVLDRESIRSEGKSDFRLQSKFIIENKYRLNVDVA